MRMTYRGGTTGDGTGRRAEWRVFLSFGNGGSGDGLVVVLVSLYEEEVMMMTAQDRMTLRRGSHDRRL